MLPLTTCTCVDVVQVIVTVPLAVLKANMVAFSPPLSARKKAAIENLGAGLVEKVRSDVVGFLLGWWKRWGGAGVEVGWGWSGRRGGGGAGVVEDVSAGGED